MMLKVFDGAVINITHSGLDKGDRTYKAQPFWLSLCCPGQNLRKKKSRRLLALPRGDAYRSFSPLRAGT